MLKRTFKFNDLDGNPTEETYWFNFSVAELAEMMLTAEGGNLEQQLQSIVATGDPGLILRTFKELIGKSVGKRAPNGKSFMKSPEIAAEFLGSPAYEEFFMELCTDANAGANFINAIMPADLMEKAAKLQAKQGHPGATPSIVQMDEVKPKILQQPLTVEDFTAKELLNMEHDTAVKLFNGELFEKPFASKTIDEYSKEELMAMPQEMFDAIVGTDPRKMDKRMLFIAMQRRVTAK